VIPRLAIPPNISPGIPRSHTLQYPLIYPLVYHDPTPCNTPKHPVVSLPGAARRQTYKPLLVELCLTLPAPLSALLQQLPRLMRPLVTALK
jgi:hypothetical protein